MTQVLGTVFPADAPGYEVMPAGAPAGPLIDADAPIWREAHVIDWGPERYRTRFQALWDPLALHVRFDAVDDSPWHTMTARDEHLWEEEVVEIFLDAGRSGRNYAEIEISPANVVCDLRVETPWPSLRSLTEWDWEGMTSAVVPRRDAHGAVEGWTAVARLPWAGLASLYTDPEIALPPAAGSAWWFNVFRIKRPGGPARRQDGVVLAAWSKPAGPSFHDPLAFQLLTFR